MHLDGRQRGKLALKLEATIAARAKVNIVEGGRAGGKGLTTLSKASDPINTRAELAKAAGMSEGQIAKVKKIEAAGSRWHLAPDRRPDRSIRWTRPPCVERDTGRVSRHASGSDPATRCAVLTIAVRMH